MAGLDAEFEYANGPEIIDEYDDDEQLKEGVRGPMIDGFQMARGDIWLFKGWRGLVLSVDKYIF